MQTIQRAPIPVGHPYLPNKYTQWYYNIIVAAKNRPPVKGYSEKHHIIPRSMGGEDDSSNLVKLTAREHYLVHMLLIRMTTDHNHYKMLHAAWYLSNKAKPQHTHKVNARLYESLKTAIAEAKSKRLSGRTLPAETRLKLSQRAKGRVKSPEHIAKLAESNRGKKLTPEAIAQRTATRRANGGYICSDETRAKLRARTMSPESNLKRALSLTGRTQSEESNRKRSESHKGKKKSPEHVAKMIASRIASGKHRRTPESIAKGLATKAANLLKKGLGDQDQSL
jgi:hypothetical protein